MDPHDRDELEIRRLVDRYCDAACRRDRDAWLETWAEEPEHSPSWELLGRPIDGLEAIAATFDGALAMLRFVVQTHSNGVVEVDGDRARGRFTLTEWSESDALGRALLLFFYHDEYVRTGDGWRFLSRRMELLYQGPPDLSAGPPPGAAR
ncbi:MAG: nuclear transport factor 2 family protein [Myxococcota bacterium]|nr:nuclear transport factor 2 family protein [Myxococcota bacterium]